MGYERELKYLATLPNAPALPEGWSLGSELPVAQIRDTYLDRAGVLAARGWALRRREVAGSATLYTLKRNAQRSGALHHREEIEAAGDEIPAQIVRELGDLVATELRELVQLQQRRQSWPLLKGSRTVGHLTIDQITSERVAWCELELEFLQDLRGEEVEALAQELQRHLAAESNLRPSSQSKEERAIAAR